MKLISWNVNGLRACIQKGFMDFFNEQDADIFALQETKLQPHQIELELPGYHQYWHSAERKGYSGTAVFTKQKPLSVRYDFDEAEGEHPKEGRVITLEFEQFYFVTAYVPNSKEELARLDYRMQWEDAMARHLAKLNETKPVVALFGGEDGLKFYRQVFAAAPQVLKDKAMMAFEIGWNQKAALLAEVRKTFGDVRAEVVKDINGKDRMLFVYFNL